MNGDLPGQDPVADPLRADLGAMRRLLELARAFAREPEIRPLLQSVVDTAISISGADFGSVQILDAETGVLRIAAQRGFQDRWVEFWNNAAAGHGTCGNALARGERVIVEDVERGELFSELEREIQLEAGVRAVQSTPLVGRTGKPVGIFSTHYRRPHRPESRELALLDLLAAETVDLIGRAQAEQSLRASEENLRLASNAAQIGTYAWDMLNDRGEWSPDTERNWGLSAGSFGGRYSDWVQVVHPDDRAEADAAFRRALADPGAPFELEHRVRRPDGEVRWVLNRACFVRDSDGRPIRVLGINMDITSRKSTEAVLREANRELERRVEAHTQALVARSAQLARLSSALPLAEQRAREALASALHGDIGAVLSNTRQQVEQALRRRTAAGEPAADLAALLAPLDAVIATANMLAEELAPPALREHGLAAALEWLAGWLHDRHGLLIHLVLDPAVDPIAWDIRVLSFEAVREILWRAARQQGVGGVHVELAAAGSGHFRIGIRVAGASFELAGLTHEPVAPETAIALFALQERLAFLGGRLEMESTPDQGVRLTLVAPRQPDAMRPAAPPQNEP